MDILEELEITSDYFQAVHLSYDIIDTIYEWNMEYKTVDVLINEPTLPLSIWVKYPSLFGKIWIPTGYMFRISVPADVFMSAYNGYITYYEYQDVKGKRVNGYYVWNRSDGVYNNDKEDVVAIIRNDFIVLKNGLIISDFIPTKSTIEGFKSNPYVDHYLEDPITVSDIDDEYQEFGVLVKKSPQIVAYRPYKFKTLEEVFTEFVGLIGV